MPRGVIRPPIFFENRLPKGNGSHSPTCSRNGAKGPPISLSSVFDRLLCRFSRPSTSLPRTPRETKKTVNERLYSKTPTQPHAPTETQFHPQRLAPTELRRFIRRDPISDICEIDVIRTLLTTTCDFVARRAENPTIVTRFRDIA